MKVILPTSTIDCEEYYETEIGRFKFIGIKMKDKPRLSMVVVKGAKVVNVYKTKMRSIDDVRLLFDRIKEDRDNSIYRSFKAYANSWVSKTKFLRVPENKPKQEDN